MNQKAQDSTRNRQPVIHRAPWIIVDTAGEIYPDAQGVIADGVVVTEAGRIRAVGKFKEITGGYPGISIRDHESRILAPGLINAHCHLELSFLKLAETAEKQSGYADDPTDWIRDLIRMRETFCLDPDSGGKIIDYARRALEGMSAEGVIFVGDIGNFLASRTIGREGSTEVNFLLEILGLSRESETRSLKRLEQVQSDPSLDVSCTAHAPYSSTPGLIRQMKHIADSRGRIFSIHTAETRHEIEFLRTGSGKFLDFLKERNAWDNSFTVPGTGPVRYLDSLGVLNVRTLCVHVVHPDSQEVEILAARGAKVCLCPGSNRFLGVGKAPVTHFLDHGILPALGTDSRASNWALSIWREMRLLREDHPGLSPATVFSMATRGGAEAWGVDDAIGTLQVGKRARIIGIDCPPETSSVNDILEYLTSAGESVGAGLVGLG